MSVDNLGLHPSTPAVEAHTSTPLGMTGVADVDICQARDEPFLHPLLRGVAPAAAGDGVCSAGADENVCRPWTLFDFDQHEEDGFRVKARNDRIRPPTATGTWRSSC